MDEIDGKLSDSTTSRQQKHFTNRVVTLWYRAPELLLGDTEYTTKVDVWACGCVFGELLMKAIGNPFSSERRAPAALFPGLTELDQVHCIFRFLGTPTKQSWPTCDRLPWFHHFTLKQSYPNVLTKYFSPERFGHAAVDLLGRMLALDPTQRVSISEALCHPFFHEDPEPMTPGSHPHYSVNHHELEMKRRSRAKRNQTKESMGPESMGSSRRRPTGSEPSSSTALSS